jgi:hypothetical protein
MNRTFRSRRHHELLAEPAVPWPRLALSVLELHQLHVLPLVKFLARVMVALGLADAQPS